MTFEPGEVVDEHSDQLFGLAVIGLFVRPCGARVEDRRPYAGYADRGFEPKIRIGAERTIDQRSVKRRRQERTRGPDRLRSPTPWAPPVHPVLTSQQLILCRATGRAANCRIPMDGVA